LGILRFLFVGLVLLEHADRQLNQFLPVGGLAKSAVIPRWSEAECGGPMNTGSSTVIMGGPNKSGHDAEKRATVPNEISELRPSKAQRL
jgi:hypothetical protein